MRLTMIALALAGSVSLAACSGSSEPAGDANASLENVSEESLGSDNLSAIDPGPLDNLGDGNAALPADDLGNAADNASDAAGNDTAANGAG